MTRPGTSASAPRSRTSSTSRRSATSCGSMAPGRLIRLSARDGRELGSEPIEYLDPAGRFLQSSTAPQLPVWHGAQPVLIRSEPGADRGPGPRRRGDPADRRRAAGCCGRAASSGCGAASARRGASRSASPARGRYDAQLVLDGRLFVLAQQRAPRAERRRRAAADRRRGLRRRAAHPAPAAGGHPAR